MKTTDQPSCDELRSFVRRITLDLQKHTSLIDAQWTAWFQEAYRLYVKYDVENAAMSRRGERKEVQF